MPIDIYGFGISKKICTNGQVTKEFHHTSQYEYYVCMYGKKGFTMDGKLIGSKYTKPTTPVFW